MARLLPKRTTVERINQLCDYQLHYSRSPEKRDVHTWGISAPDIDNAYKNGDHPTSSGEWHFGTDDFGDDWARRIFQAAINESVHEALEWFHVGNKPLIDPHGKNENNILELIDEFCQGLWDLTKGGAQRA